LAFLLAPLALPLICIAYGLVWEFPREAPLPLLIKGAAVSFAIFAAGAYLGIFILGAPIYFVLRGCNHTAFWIAPVAGFIAGGMMFVPLFGVLGMGMGGPLGALVATAFWLIARPDRQAQPASVEEGAGQGLPSRGEG
jgi:hypothetical protein